MKIAILGTGDVGKALGKAFLALGHEVKMGAREATNEKATTWAKEMGEKASCGAFADAAQFGEIIVLATLGVANEAVLTACGFDNLANKLILDTTNPLDFSKGMPPTLAVSGNDSGGEVVQRLAPKSHVVKVFNTVGHAFMYKPDFAGGPPDMFICGNSDEAKKTVSQLLKDFGWGVIDVGGIECSKYLEAMCLVWVLSAIKTGTWGQAFKMLRK